MIGVRPLDGVTVIEFAQLIAGPSSALMLRDLGARVIKVESFAGDPGRELRTQAFAASGNSAIFDAYNRGKLSLAVNLKESAGRDIAAQLIQEADVVIESFRPGVMERLGLGFDQMIAGNKRLIYASLSAFGHEGPESDRRGVDFILQAESGIMSITGEMDGGPLKVGFTIVDAASGYVLTQAILASLLLRERTGRGQLVRVSLLDVAMHLQSAPFGEFLASHVEPIRMGNAAPMTSPADSLRTADGYIVLSAYLEDHWRRLCECIGRPELADDERFATKIDRVNHRLLLKEELEASLRTWTTRDAVDKFRESGLAAGTVKSYGDLELSPQVASNGMIMDIGVDGGDAHRAIRSPYRLDDRRLPESSEPAPAVGQHTVAVLRHLGYSEEQCQLLIANGTVVHSDDQTPGAVAAASGGNDGNERAFPQ